MAADWSSEILEIEGRCSAHLFARLQVEVARLVRGGYRAPCSITTARDRVVLCWFQSGGQGVMEVIIR